MNIYIWGTGHIAQRYLEIGEIQEEYICGYIESSRSKSFFRDKPIYEPIEVKKFHYDYILVLVNYYTIDIKTTAIENGLDINKFIFIDTILWHDDRPIFENDKMRTVVKYIPCSNDEENVRNIFPELFRIIDDRRFYVRSIISTYGNAKDDIDENVITLRDGFDSRIYSDDYFRYRTFELVADEVIRSEIEGECAEVGVYRGYFSRLINRKLCKRKLYLFDSFEGFINDEIEKEISNCNSPKEFKDAFTDTSVELVINSMPYPEMCIIKKGFFPDTAVGLENVKFAFVSVDVDLEDSILECLRFFFPRMVKGGYIFVHDYNNRFFYGVKEAIKKYEKEIEENLHKVPIADQGGTIIIQK